MPFQPGESGNTKGRPKGALNKATREAKEFAERFLCSPTYRASARKRVLAGEAHHLEVLWHHYAFGKPKDSVEITGDSMRPLVIDRVSTRQEMLDALGEADTDAGSEDE